MVRISQVDIRRRKFSKALAEGRYRREQKARPAMIRAAATRMSIILSLPETVPNLQERTSDDAP